MNDQIAGLVIEARAGDRDAFGLLVEFHWEGLVRLARSVLGDSDAEDAAQDGLLIAWRKLPKLSEPGAFSAWISRIVYRRCLRRLRRRRGVVTLEKAPEPLYNTDPDNCHDVWKLLAILAPRQRAVLHLTTVEGLTDSEIGRSLGITAGSVRAHRRRAREKIQRFMKGET